jgi:general secretion pathway protein D
MTRHPITRIAAITVGVFATGALKAEEKPRAGTLPKSGAKPGAIEAAADREKARREAAVDAALKGPMAAADSALAEKDYEKAFVNYRAVLDFLPSSPLSEKPREHAVDRMCTSGVKLAEQRIAEGRYSDAENVLQTILEDRYNPKCRDAVIILARLETPGYYNKTVTPKFRANIEEVKKLMLEAEGFYQTGRLDLAFKRCEQVLTIDRYNVAARRMEERINQLRDKSAVAGYNEARSRAMWKVDDAWGNPVRKFGSEKQSVVVQETEDVAGTARINSKLNRIIIPKVEFKDSTIREAIQYLKDQSTKLDTQESDPALKGVNIVLKLDSGGSAAAPAAPAPDAAGMAAAAIPGLELPAPGGGGGGGGATAGGPAGDTPITLTLGNVPLGAALKYVTNLANLKIKVEQYAVTVVPITTPTEVLLTKNFSVRPNFIGRSPAGGGPGALDAGGGGPGAGAGAIAGKIDAKEFLIAQGVAFGPGATASYQAATSKLVVRNTAENLELIGELIAASDTATPAQVDIEAKFVEITQNNMKELGFDWLLGRFNVNQGGVFAGGGTPGTSPALVGTDYTFNQPAFTDKTGRQFAQGPVGNNPVTAGNRSGSNAISANAIDALLFGAAGSSRMAPAIMTLAGIFTDPQFQLAIRALNQKKGVDLLSAPRVTTRSGQKATIEITRDFRYPTEFDPPQIPQQVGAQGGGGVTIGGVGGAGGAGQPQNFPVTPTTPTSFETQKVGVTLEVEPTIGPDGYTIDMQLTPQVTEFEGFINYGSPIQTTSLNALGQPVVNIVTPNVINQPIFSRRTVTTNVSIYDGSTVVLGGLIREDVQKVEDKVPLLGDLPMVGRLFRSSVDQHIKRNLMIFVSARLLTPSGELVRNNEETEEIVETVALPEVAAPQINPDLPLMPK